MPDKFRVGLTRDFLNADGSLGFGDIGLSLLDEHPAVDWEFIPSDAMVIPHTVADSYDALLVLAPQVTDATLDGCRRLKLVARFGVGFDNIDVDACTRNAVLLTITPDGVRRPVAVSAIAFLLALSHRLLAKDRLTRDGRWGEKLNYMGKGVTGRTLGIIGLGNIGREVCTLALPFEMQYLAYDPFADPETAMDCHARLTDLDSLLGTSDFVCVTCALTPDTHHLLNSDRLQLMKPDAYLINVSRGGVIDQVALTGLLQQRRIAGAALDVFETEPIDPNDPLLSLDNVILAPHAVCWTDELFLGNGRAACQSILDVAEGKFPDSVVNQGVLEDRRLIDKLN